MGLGLAIGGGLAGALGAATIGAGVIGAGAQIYSANKAADAQKNAANKAISAQEQMYNTTRNDLLPYNTAGQGALTSLNNLLSGDPNKVQAQLSQLPGYQFTLNQGLQSVQSGAAARGLGTSGAALRGAADYTTGLAQQNYGNYVNQLQNLVNTGESAAAQTGAYGTQTGQGISNSLTGIGNAQAAGSIATGNAISGLTNNISGLYLTNALLQNQGMPGLFKSSGGLYGSVGSVPSASTSTYGYGQV